jgi:hypothetical protein
MPSCTTEARRSTRHINGNESAAKKKINRYISQYIPSIYPFISTKKDVNNITTLENRFSLETKQHLPCGPATALLGIYSEKGNLCLCKKQYMNFHDNFIHNCHKLETMQISFNS